MSFCTLEELVTLLRNDHPAKAEYAEIKQGAEACMHLSKLAGQLFPGETLEALLYRLYNKENGDA